MLSAEFKKQYGRLNKKQKEAVLTIEGPVMVIAGPGTGKTTILTLRIANILRLTDTPPSGILALTFTEAGVKAMREKLRGVIGDRALEVPIHTFHSFAASVIAEFGDHFPHIAHSKQITEVEAESILRGIIKEKRFWKLRPLGDPDFYIPKIISTISEAKREAWTPEMLRSFSKEEAERVKNDSSSISSRGKSKGTLKAEALKRIEKCERTLVFADVYEAYELKKAEEKKIDFDDLLFELLKALRTDKLLLQLLQEKYLYILLDEHQDTNDSQNLIVRAIADFYESPNLFVVGDDKQAIYRFQGASVENFLSFQKIWNHMKVISLEDNYRSHQHLLDASFKMIEKNYAENEYKNLRIKLKAGTGKKAMPLELIIAPNTETEEINLIGKIKAILKKDKESKIAVIVRKNSDVARFFSLFERSGIPVQAERGANIFSHPAGCLYFSLLQFLANPENYESLAETFSGGLWNLDFAKQTGLTKSLRSGNPAMIEKEIPAIPALLKKMKNAGAVEYLLLAADLSGFSEITMQDHLSVEVWRGIISLAEDLAKSGQIEDPKSLINELLSYKKSAERKQIKINSGAALAQVIVMTAHGSKGLEFDYVFLPFATEESWIRKNHGSYFVLPKEKESEDDIRDERRLFYVALTRSKKHVCISYHEENGLGRSQLPLRFIEELDQQFISQKNLPRAEMKRAPQSLQKMKERQNAEEIEYTKMALIEKGLSVTALNHFLQCPNKFFYKSILKLPEAPSASSEKGSAMHEALAEVWGSSIPRAIASTIISSVKNYLKNSFLPSSEKEAVLEELVANAPKVAAALAEHFSQKGDALTEIWEKINFPFSYGGKKMEIIIHGRLDAMIETEDKVLVYDYKTKEAMSAKAITGESGDSNGGYFRQLVFYKILLEGNSRFKNKAVEPALVFVKPDNKGRCPTVALPIEKSDIEKVKSEINSLLDLVWSGKLLSQTCNDENCQYCGYRKLLR